MNVLHAPVGCLPFRMWRSRQSGVRNGFPGTRSPGSALCASGRRPVWDFLDRTIPFGPIGGSIGTCTGLGTMHQAAGLHFFPSNSAGSPPPHACGAGAPRSRCVCARVHVFPRCKTSRWRRLFCSFLRSCAAHLRTDMGTRQLSEWVELVFEEFCRGLDLFFL